jgi:type I restriction enzyme S subunit
MTEKRKVPELRFKEFSGEWDYFPLNNIAEQIRTKSDENIEAVLTISAAKGFISQKERFSKVIAGNSLKNYTLLEKNMFAYNKGNSKLYTYGCIFAQKEYKRALVPNVYICFNFYNANVQFYEKLFENKYMDKYLRKIITTTARMDGLLNVNRDNFMKIAVPSPSIEEQNKIGSFLSTVDGKLENIEGQIEHLETLKKGFLQKIFSQELRFKDVNGNEFPDWEEKKLGEVFKISAGGDIEKSRVSKRKSAEYRYPVFANALSNNGLYGYSDTFKIDTDAITVTGRGDIGCAISRHIKYYPIVRLLSLVPKIDFNVDFGANAINLINFFVESTGVPQLTGPQISNYRINIPNIIEQQKIADFVLAFDEKIRIEQDKSQYWKNIKKSLLQRMFV